MSSWIDWTGTLSGGVAPHWQSRVKWKLAATAVVTAGVSMALAKRKGLALTHGLPQQLWGYCSSMGMFCVVQESLRAIRDQHDAANTGIAGAVAGALLSSRYKGSKYARIGALVWAVIATSAHVANDIIRPRLIIEDILIHGGLLSPIVAERRIYDQVSGRSPAKQHTHAVSSVNQQSPSSEQAQLYQDAAMIRKREIEEISGVRLIGRRVTTIDTQKTSNNQPINRADEHSQHFAANNHQRDGMGSTASQDLNEAHQSSSGSSRLKWLRWPWKRNKGEDAQSPVHQHAQSPNSSSTSHSNDDQTDGVIQDDDAEAKEFEAWLASQKMSPDGLVLPYGKS